MENKVTFKDYEKEILFLLNNPWKINKVSFFEKSYFVNAKKFYEVAKEKNDNEFTVECTAYLLGKSCEITILERIRPELKRIWISLEDVSEHIVTNLPCHLHDEVLEVMSGCENAVEQVLNSNTNVEELFMNIQFIGEYLTNKYKLYDVTVEGYSNKEIAIPSELYTFANNVLIKELVKEGYVVDIVSESNMAAVSLVLSKGNIKMAVLESVVVDSKEPRFSESQKKKLLKYALEKMYIPYIVAVGLSSNNEDAKNKNVVPLNGPTVVKRSDFIRID